LAELFLSIVIPAYNEENRLPKTLDQIFEFLAAQPYTAEVLVVENGSRDNTLQIARAYEQRHPNLRVFHLEGRGKGLAVKYGMLEARGKHRFMCDADLSMPISEVNRFLPPMLDHYEIAIGSREAPGAVRYKEPAYRHIGGRAVNTMIRLLALPGLQDTQCGFKCFCSDAAEDLFREQTLTGWSFDIELLYIARKRGYRIVEVPIPWHFNPESKVSAVKDAIKMGMDILTIRWNGLRGVYNAKV